MGESNAIMRRRLFSAAFAAGVAFVWWTAVLRAEDTATPPGWTPATYRAVTSEALRLMPPSLARVVVPYSDALMEGAVAPSEAHRKGKHVLDSRGQGDLPAEIERAVAEGLRLLERQAPLRELAYQLGVMSHLASDFADPLRAVHDHPASRRIGADFAAYTEQNRLRFRPAFLGYPERFLAADLSLAAERWNVSARERHALLVRAYFPRGEAEDPVSSRTFTVRSPAFGVASLSYSHAVSGTALVWAHFWHRARGDMRGTPFLAAEHRPAPERGAP